MWGRRKAQSPGGGARGEKTELNCPMVWPQEGSITVFSVWVKLFILQHIVLVEFSSYTAMILELGKSRVDWEIDCLLMWEPNINLISKHVCSTRFFQCRFSDSVRSSTFLWMWWSLLNQKPHMTEYFLIMLLSPQTSFNLNSTTKLKSDESERSAGRHSAGM